MFSFSSLFAPSSSPRCDAAPPPPPPALLDAPPSSGGGSASQASPPPPAATADTGDSAIAEAAAAATAYSNPGPFEGLSNAAKALVYVDTFDGARVDINKQLSPMMMTNHNFWLGTSMLQAGSKNYTFSTQVVPDDSTFVMARLGLDGQVEGRLHKVLVQNEDLQSSAKLVVVASPDKAGGNDQMVVDVDVNSKTWSGQAKAGTMGGGTYFSCNYLQSVTPRLSLGGDCTYIGAQEASCGSYGARYEGRRWMGAVQWSGMQGALSANYKRTVTKDR